MQSFGSVDLAPAVATAPADVYRRFVRLLPREDPAESLNGTEVTRFEIPEVDDLERWMVIVFDAQGATYRIEGQLLSPDLLSPTDPVLSFLGRSAYSSASFDPDVPLDPVNARDAFRLVMPVLSDLARRVGENVGFPAPTS